jgi:hypothetical protein
MTASTHDTALRWDNTGVGLVAEITQRVVAAGLTLEETAAIAADSLVRRGIEKALDNLDQVVRAVRDADFGTEHHPNPGRLSVHHPSPHRRLFPAKHGKPGPAAGRR